jgi:hypothetical protein
VINNLEYFGEIDLRPLIKPKYSKGSTLKRRWWRFHKANPHVYDALRDMALHLKRRGFKKCGISLLWERLRWLSYIHTFGVDEYKLSNSHRAFYARYLMLREEELKDFFEIRHQPSEE